MIMKDELKYASTVPGEQCVTETLVQYKQILCVASLDSCLKVRLCIYNYICSKVQNNLLQYNLQAQSHVTLVVEVVHCSFLIYTVVELKLHY